MGVVKLRESLWKAASGIRLWLQDEALFISSTDVYDALYFAFTVNVEHHDKLCG